MPKATRNNPGARSYLPTEHTELHIMVRSLSNSISGLAATYWLCLSLGASPRQIARMLPGPDNGDSSFGLGANRAE